MAANEGVMWMELIEVDFIELVKDKRHLWDPKHQFYINSRLKQCDYKNIAKILLSKWPEHASLFTFAKLTAKFSSIKKQYKEEWKKQKDEGKSASEWEHYQRLSFLEDIVSKESELLDNVESSSVNDFDDSEINEISESPLLDNVTIKKEIDDSHQAEQSIISLDISEPSPENIVTITDTREEQHIDETNQLNSRLSQELSCSSPNCKLLYVKALDTVKEVVNKTSSSNADVAFGCYVGSMLASIPNSERKETLKIKIMEVLTKAKYNETSAKYTIIKLEDQIQLVPTCWLTEDESHCYWPINTTTTKIMSMVEKLTEPDKKNWKCCKVLQIYDTSHGYRRGLDKMKQWITDVTTTTTRSSNFSNQRKHRQHPKDSASHESDYGKDQRAEKDGKDLGEPPLKRRISMQDTARRIHSSSRTSSPVKHTTAGNSVLSLRKTKRTRDETQLIPHKNDKDSMEAVIQMLTSISKRLKVLENPAFLNKANCVETNPSVLSDVLKIFPILTSEQMENLEIFLSEEENERLMVAALKVIGGSGDDQLVTNILKRCIADAVGEQYSWLGTKQKKAFKSLQFSSVMFQCVRHHSQSITEDKFASVVANWLRHCKQRRERQDIMWSTNLLTEGCM